MLRLGAGALAVLVLAVVAGTVNSAGSTVLTSVMSRPIERSADASPREPAKSTIAQATGQIVNPTPVRLLIPRIHLDAKVEARGLDSHRNLDTASDPNDAAWYELGPAPGQPGNAIINGHVDWWTGGAVFTHLASVRPNDIVEVVRADGQIETFRITLLQRVAVGTRIPSLFVQSGPPTLTLITCAGVWNPITFTNTERLLVSATLA